MHTTYPGLQWSVENYKWDVTNTAPVKLTVIGKNGQILLINTLTSYFACYWAYGLYQLYQTEVASIFDLNPKMEVIEPSSRTQKELLPDTPSEDNTDLEMIKKMTKDGWAHIGNSSGDTWKKLLDAIGLCDVDPVLFKQLVTSAAFPGHKKSTYCTETTGYYCPNKIFPKNELPGVGGVVRWGKLPDYTVLKEHDNKWVIYDIYRLIIYVK